MKDGVPTIWCLKYKEDVNYGGWSHHCSRRHPVQGSDGEEHNNDDAGNKRKDDDADRPGHHCAGVGDVVSTHAEAQGWLPKERGRKCRARTPQKGRFRRLEDTETEEGKSSTQREVKPG